MQSPQITKFLKRAIGLLPSPLDLRALEGLRWLSSGRARRKRRRVARILEGLGDATEIRGGPFRGMRYLNHQSASQGEFLPKLLGTYELELSSVLDELFAMQPDIIVNVGAAEGYYAIGFALRISASRVLAFEMETPYHTAIRELAVKNDVAHRVDVRGECGPRELGTVLARAQRPLVICDCEGAEDKILDPAMVPALRSATIVVEIHELLCPGVSLRIRERFRRTHDVRVLSTRPRTASDLPTGIRIATEDVAFALGEGRSGPMEWFFMRPLLKLSTTSERRAANAERR